MTAVHAPSAPAGPASPGWVADDEPADPVRRETLWYDHALGVDDPQPAPWVSSPDLLAATEGSATARAAADALLAPGAAVALPTGLWRAWGDAVFPAAAAQPPAVTALGLAALATAPVRRDPDDPYNDHRAYPSPRCLFPVHALASHDGQWHLVDPLRREAFGTGEASRSESVVLTGRYDRIPTDYGWFRGSLVTIETGILVRHLAVLAGGLGRSLSLQMPVSGWSSHPPSTGWQRPEDWSPPLALTLGASCARAPGDPGQVAPGAPPPAGEHLLDPAADVERTYRDHVFPPADHPVPAGRPDPATPAVGRAGWPDALWRRSAGRMPRRLWGFRVSDRPLSGVDLLELAAWASCPAPTPFPTDALELRAVVRDVEGWRPGVYRLTPEGLVPAARVGPQALAGVGNSYLYDSSARSRNDIHRAPLLWVLTARPRQITSHLGPAGWTAMHLASGWVTQGLCLGAAARHLLARPVRAFDERVLATALALDPDEMPCLGVVVGHHQPHGGLQIDLRS